jgi:glutathione synthase/RimK-type ligase-like ATP-grasp enzyme
MSNVRSIVKELSEEDFDGKTLGPALFQEFVQGENIRVHVVGGKVFASAIQSAGVDYRYAPAEMAPMQLPDEIAARSVALAHRLGLTLAGLDLIRTRSGEWYCLEVNPNPAFTSFPEGEQVARAVARLLADAAKVKRPRAAFRLPPIALDTTPFLPYALL